MALLHSRIFPDSGGKQKRVLYDLKHKCTVDIMKNYKLIGDGVNMKINHRWVITLDGETNLVFYNDEYRWTVKNIKEVKVSEVKADEEVALWIEARLIKASSVIFEVGADIYWLNTSGIYRLYRSRSIHVGNCEPNKLDLSEYVGESFTIDKFKDLLYFQYREDMCSYWYVDGDSPALYHIEGPQRIRKFANSICGRRPEIYTSHIIKFDYSLDGRIICCDSIPIGEAIAYNTYLWTNFSYCNGVVTGEIQVNSNLVFKGSTDKKTVMVTLKVSDALYEFECAYADHATYGPTWFFIDVDGNHYVYNDEEKTLTDLKTCMVHPGDIPSDSVRATSSNAHGLICIFVTDSLDYWVIDLRNKTSVYISQKISVRGCELFPSCTSLENFIDACTFTLSVKHKQNPDTFSVKVQDAKLHKETRMLQYVTATGETVYVFDVEQVTDDSGSLQVV